MYTDIAVQIFCTVHALNGWRRTAWPLYIYDILLDPNNHIPNTCLDMFKWSCMFSGVVLAIGLLEILHLHMGRCNTLGVIYSGDVVVFPRQVYPLVL